MSPVQTNTQQGLIIASAASDLTASIGRFANIGSDGNTALPSANGHALYVIEDANSSGGVITPPSGTLTGAAYTATLRPLSPDRNVRVVSNAVLAIADKVTTDSAGRAVKASSGNNVLAIVEEAGVVGQYVLMRPLAGIQTL